ncbi:sucrose-6-phosphate hydrolase [Paenibacillus glucanolyticus]|jgi:beta-fructofuranosidase|uniref:Sucrose-6-phosphate hydrolase n=1 Tax=Paenibacillus glucanolyticus TaxID=59843 RepID=A0A163DW19_9BACL|nr:MULTISPECIES: sucrose-6-phosphate hydrolase [Paenibacillus]ANA82866.1 sucrose-6-phosphate hydrolase [Paenibacillus glucanolyticus]AVV58047.1 sucrose-6-phosphate hydrolase [Paenibacillus glucanolyticus]ETT42787.1 sucrose-6-phosphate hydrolase [Paenibacillus sp. FSL R5-808]KZS43462.1 sucrose-6-phosphate hydrolase [Paenibacillus glucanolyticus]
MDRELKYRRLDQASPEEIASLRRQARRSEWRQTFHIQPVMGLMNDPNGFSYYNGEYHLFYQWFPLGTFHGLKYWYHTSSKDLVHWHNKGIAIEPGQLFDAYGAYSGSGIVKDNKLYLLYTGNARDEEWNRQSYQCMAVMDRDGSITKLDKPLIDHVPDGYTEHFRDPKVWKDQDKYRFVIGAQRVDQTGSAVIYESSDLLSWEFKGEIQTRLEHFGYMWECPDYFELEGQGVLLFSPQGLLPEDDHFQNIYQSGYISGKPLKRDTLELDHGSFCELDRGFDFYAPQTMLDEKDRRIMVGWMGLPDIGYPTDSHGWAHCLTLPRMLTFREGRLNQQPVPELQVLRDKVAEAADTLHSEVKSYKGVQGTAFEMICEFQAIEADVVGIEFRAGEGERTVIRYESGKRKVTLDRSSSGASIVSDYGTVRSCKLPTERNSIKFHLFVDISSVELFINDGEEVFTSRIFPKCESRNIRFFVQNGSAGLKVAKWDLTEAVKDKEGDV